MFFGRKSKVFLVATKILNGRAEEKDKDEDEVNGWRYRGNLSKKIARGIKISSIPILSHLIITWRL